MTWKTQLFLAKSLSCSLAPGIQVRDTGADGSYEVSLYGPVTVTLIIFVNLLEGIVKRSIFTEKGRYLKSVSAELTRN